MASAGLTEAGVAGIKVCLLLVVLADGTLAFAGFAVRGLDGIATVFRRGVERVTFTRVGIVRIMLPGRETGCKFLT